MGAEALKIKVSVRPFSITVSSWLGIFRPESLEEAAEYVERLKLDEERRGSKVEVKWQEAPYPDLRPRSAMVKGIQVYESDGRLLTQKTLSVQGRVAPEGVRAAEGQFLAPGEALGEERLYTLPDFIEWEGRHFKRQGRDSYVPASFQRVE
jgi:hypothetical protein